MRSERFSPVTFAREMESPMSTVQTSDRPRARHARALVDANVACGLAYRRAARTCRIEYVKALLEDFADERDRFGARLAETLDDAGEAALPLESTSRWFPCRAFAILRCEACDELGFLERLDKGEECLAECYARALERVEDTPFAVLLRNQHATIARDRSKVKALLEFVPSRPRGAWTRQDDERDRTPRGKNAPRIQARTVRCEEIYPHNPTSHRGAPSALASSRPSPRPTPPSERSTKKASRSTRSPSSRPNG
jgi:hypothetical protein